MRTSRGSSSRSSFRGRAAGLGDALRKASTGLYPTHGVKGKPIFITTNGRQRIGGIVFGDYLRKTVDRRKHYCRSVGGWGVDETVLQKARFYGANRVLIVETDGAESSATIDAFFEDGIAFSVGYGKQLVLPESHFTRSDSQQGRLF